MALAVPWAVVGLPAKAAEPTAGVLAGAEDAAIEAPLPDPPDGPPAPTPLTDLLRVPLMPGALSGPASTAALAGLPDPPSAPPAPPVLDAPASSASATEAPPAALPAPDPLAGVETRRGGGYRLRVAGAAEGSPLDPAAALAAQAIGRRLATEGPATGRITVLAQVAAPGTETSVHRRLALARALAVKAALVAGGVEPTRIDLRPLGHTAEAVDAVDILPPGAQREAATTQGGSVAR